MCFLSLPRSFGHQQCDDQETGVRTPFRAVCLQCGRLQQSSRRSRTLQGLWPRSFTFIYSVVSCMLLFLFVFVCYSLW